MLLYLALALGILMLAFALWAARSSVKEQRPEHPTFDLDHSNRPRVGIPEPEMWSAWEWDDEGGKHRRSVGAKVESVRRYGRAA